MKVIIAGSRSIDDYGLVEEAVEKSGFDISRIISGGAEGVDALGEKYGKESAIPVGIIPADWDKHGRSAGPKRNAKMAKHADALIAVWDGISPGTKDMLNKMHKLGKPIFLSHAGDKPDWTNQ